MVNFFFWDMGRSMHKRDDIIVKKQCPYLI